MITNGNENQINTSLPQRTLIHSSTLTEAIVEFAESAFRGCISVELDGECDGLLLISEDQLALYFKELIAGIYGRANLNVKIHSGEEHLTIRFSPTLPVSISQSEAGRLARLARGAGMSLELDGGEIRAYLDFVHDADFSIYALGVREAKALILSRLCEAFS